MSSRAPSLLASPAVDPAADPALDDILRERAAHLRHMAALRDWAIEMEEQDGPLTDEDRAWARRWFARSDAQIAAKQACRPADAR